MPIDWSQINKLKDSDKDQGDSNTQKNQVPSSDQIPVQNQKTASQDPESDPNAITVEEDNLKSPIDMFMNFAMEELQGAGRKLDTIRQMSVGLGEFALETVTGLLGATAGTIAGGNAATFESMDPNQSVIQDINENLAMHGLEQMKIDPANGPANSPQSTFMSVFGATLDAMTYHPSTEYGKALSGAVGNIFSKFSDWGNDAGTVVMDQVKGTPLESVGPELATAVDTAISGVPYYIPLITGKGIVTWRNKRIQAQLDAKMNRIKDIKDDISTDIPPELAVTTESTTMKPSDAVQSLGLEGKFFRSPEEMAALAKEIQTKEGNLGTITLTRDQNGKLSLANEADVDLLLLGQELGDNPAKIKIQSETKFTDRPDYQQEAINADAVRIDKVYQQAEKDLADMDIKMRKSYLEQLKLALVDVSATTKTRLLEQGGPIGERAVMMHDLIAGATPRAQLVYQAWEDVIYSKLDRPEMSMLDRVIQDRRIIELDKAFGPGKIKHPGKTTGAQRSNALIKLREDIGPEKFDALWKRADKYFEATNEALGRLYTEGLINKKVYDELGKMKYEPRKFIHKLDPFRVETIGGKRITVHDSGLKNLSAGDIRSLEMDSRLLLSEYISRVENRIARNKANRSLLDFARMIPENGWVKEVKDVKLTKKGKAQKIHVPEGFNRIDVVVDGKQVPMIMDTRMAAQWVTQSPQMTAMLANTARVLSGSIIVRPLATGYNPAFALVNLPRDLSHAWIATSEYSKHLPMYGLQMTADLIATAKDAWKKDGKFKDYINEGGGMNFLTHQGTKLIDAGTGSEKLSIRWRHTKEVLSKLNEFSEIWVRLAIRDRAIKNGKTPEQATWEARNYLDFSQGGWFTKSADNMIPYMNASVQAFRTSARQVKKDPKRFAYQMLQVQGMATSMWLANYFTNPEGWNQVSSDERRNNWIIMTPMKMIDSTGNERNLYFKIKKDNFMIPFISLPEMLLERYIEGRIPDGEVLKSLKDASPVIPTEFVPPTYSMYQTYASNHDFWTDREIWRDAKGEPSSEFKIAPDQPTSPFFRDLGEWTGLSPARMEAASSKLLPNNPYTQLTGLGYKIITEGMTPYDKSKHTMEILKDTPVLRRIIGLTHPAARALEESEDIMAAGNSAKLDLSRKLDNMYFNSKQGELTGGEKTIQTWIRAQPPEEQDRLRKRLETTKIYDKIMSRQQGIFGMPPQTWWTNTGNIDSVTRAEVFYQKWRDANPIGRRAMERLANQLQAAGLGYYTEHFARRFRELRKDFGEDYNTDTGMEDKIIENRKARSAK